MLNTSHHNPSYSRDSFKLDVQTHLNILTQIFEAIQKKLGNKKVLIDPSRQKRGILNATGTLFKTVIGITESEGG